MSLTNYQTTTIESTDYRNTKSKKNIYDKSRICRGTINSGEKKSNFGSIPRKDEIFLLQKSSNNINDRFNSGHDNIYYTDTATFPGAGSYKIANDFILNRYNSISLSSNSMRFNNNNIYNEIPGVGHYNLPDKKLNDNNYRYNSLFKEKSANNIKRINSESKSKSKDKKNQNNNFNRNTIDVVDIDQRKKKLNFNSYSKREDYAGSNSLFVIKNKNPGPGSYFKNKNEISKSLKNIYHPKTFKNEYSILQTEAKNIINEMNKNNDNEKSGKMNFKLMNCRKNPSQRIIGVKEITDTYIDNTKPKPLYYRKKPDISKTKLFTEGDIPYINFKINEERELKYIKDFLGNDNGKPDIFYLNSPRWKFYEKKYESKIPGPAYYFADNKF